MTRQPPQPCCHHTPGTGCELGRRQPCDCYPHCQSYDPARAPRKFDDSWLESVNLITPRKINSAARSR